MACGEPSRGPTSILARTMPVAHRMKTQVLPYGTPFFVAISQHSGERMLRYRTLGGGSSFFLLRFRYTCSNGICTEPTQTSHGYTPVSFHFLAT
jgi:hypothetical protein